MYFAGNVILNTSCDVIIVTSLYLEQGQSVQHFVHLQFSLATRQVLHNVASCEKNEQVQQADLFKRQILLFRFSTYRSNSLKHYRVFQQVSECLEDKQERPAVADKPARRLRKVCTVYVRAVGCKLYS